MSWLISPVAWRVRSALVLFAAISALPLRASSANVPEYKLGDVAAEDVATPVALLVINPEATEALKQKVAAQVNFIVRLVASSTTEAETELRNNLTMARAQFTTKLGVALEGRIPTDADLNSPVFGAVIREVARELRPDLPLTVFAPKWARGENDSALVESLVRPLREAMLQPIVANRTELASIPSAQPVRVISVKNPTEVPTLSDLENSGTVTTAGKVLGLWRAKRMVETSFPAGQESMGKFAASFVRPNAIPDAETTAVLRARRMEGVTVNDTYEPAEVIVRQGQMIDRKALSALAAMREKSLIGTLQTKLATEKSVAGQLSEHTKWIVIGLAAVGFVLVLVLWRLRPRPSTALATISDDLALDGGAAQAALSDGRMADNPWQQRALLAEGKAARAHEAIRSGVMGWMKEKIFRTLFRHRSEMLTVQQKAEAEMRELEQRLEQLHAPLQDRISAYEKRIEELEKDLAAKGEENRQLIGARISVAKQQLVMERKRERFGIN